MSWHRRKCRKSVQRVMQQSVYHSQVYEFAFVPFIQKTSYAREGTKFLSYQIIYPERNKFEFQIHSDTIVWKTRFALHWLSGLLLFRRDRERKKKKKNLISVLFKQRIIEKKEISRTKQDSENMWKERMYKLSWQDCLKIRFLETSPLWACLLEHVGLRLWMRILVLFRL